MIMIFTISFILFNRRESSTGIGLAYFSSSSSFCLCFSFSSLSLSFSARRAFSETIIASYSSLISAYLFLRELCDDFLEATSLLVPSFIIYFSGEASYIYSTTISLSKSLTLIYYQEGRWAGVKLRQRLIKFNIPGEKNFLFKIGFLVGSNAGRSLVMTLCKMKPNDQTSIFWMSNLKRF